MKRIYLLLVIALVTLCANASERSAMMLKEIAGNVLKVKPNGTNRANVIGENKLEILHEYDGIAVVGGKSLGFAVLAIDDAFAPVLGYAYGDFDKDNINPNMRWWMECTARAMAKGATRSMDNGIPDGLPAEVESFIDSRWNQGTPYNNICPSYTQNGSTKRYPSGCVATAMAQAMYYYKYPDHGTGSRVYRFNPGDGDQTVKIVLDDIMFDWDNMLDTYSNGNYDDAQGNAVAVLMQACGAAIEMQYTAGGSGAFTFNACEALRNCFGYDRGLPFYNRWCVSADEFNREIYKNLAEKRPVIFSGANNEGGHAFILDGYDADGNVHVNWGWGGKEDGFFTIALMNGYEQQQGFIPVTHDGTFGKQKSLAGIYEGGLAVSRVDATHIKVTTNGARLLNIDCETYKGNVYVIAMNMETGVSTAIATETINNSIGVNYYFGQNGINKAYITIKNKIGDGKYRIFLATKADYEDDYSPVRCREEYTNSYFIDVKDNAIVDVMPASDPAWMSETTAIRDIKADSNTSSSVIYTLDGKRASRGYRGIVVRKGKKMLSSSAK